MPEGLTPEEEQEFLRIPLVETDMEADTVEVWMPVRPPKPSRQTPSSTSSRARGRRVSRQR